MQHSLVEVVGWVVWQQIFHMSLCLRCFDTWWQRPCCATWFSSWRWCSHFDLCWIGWDGVAAFESPKIWRGSGCFQADRSWVEYQRTESSTGLTWWTAGGFGHPSESKGKPFRCDFDREPKCAVKHVALVDMKSLKDISSSESIRYSPTGNGNAIQIIYTSRWGCSKDRTGIKDLPDFVPRFTFSAGNKQKKCGPTSFWGMWGDLFHVNVTPTPSHHALPFLDSNRPKLRACTELIFAPNCPSALFDQTCDQKPLDFADWIVYIDIKQIYQAVSSLVSLFQKAKLDESQNAKRWSTATKSCIWQMHHVRSAVLM